jgi:hypothetical protein
MDPSEVLASVHAERTRDRTVVGRWLMGISNTERTRFDEFLEAFGANPNYRMPVLIAALQADAVLGAEGAAFPDLSGESLKTWMAKRERAPETG